MKILGNCAIFDSDYIISCNMKQSNKIGIIKYPEEVPMNDDYIYYDYSKKLIYWHEFYEKKGKSLIKMFDENLNLIIEKKFNNPLKKYKLTEFKIIAYYCDKLYITYQMDWYIHFIIVYNIKTGKYNILFKKTMKDDMDPIFTFKQDILDLTYLNFQIYSRDKTNINYTNSTLLYEYHI